MSWVNENGRRYKKVSTFRRVLPQVLAASANNILLVDIGASTSFPTILISALLGAKEGISMNDTQASWIGSLCFMFQPIGSLLSGTIVEYLGRKKAMLAVNIPHIIGWILIWTAPNIATLFAANALLGFGIGLMEASIFTYIGEISQTSIRGTLVTYSTIFLTSGQCIAYLLGAVLPWRVGAATCLAIPLINIIAVLLIPESPSWLLARGKDKEAIECLQWLRGWTDKDAVMKEYEELKKYNEYSLRCQICENKDVEKVECPHKDLSKLKRFLQTFALIFKRETHRPLLLSILFFGFYNFTSVQSIKPNMVNMFRLFQMPLDEHWASVGVGVLSIIGTIISMSLIKKTGKRPLMITCMAGSSITTFLIGIYAYHEIPHNASSYGDIVRSEHISWTPLVLFTIMILFYGIGIVPIAWVLMSEVFPYRTRGHACGIAAATCYVWTFIATKTFINVETSMNFYGSFFFYASITFVGLIYLYLSLPETEHRTHEEIEREFSGDRVKIFADDIFFKKICEWTGILDHGEEKNIHRGISMIGKVYSLDEDKNKTNIEKENTKISHINKGFISES